MSLFNLTLSELRAGLDRRDFSSAEATRACLERIAATDPQLNAFITVCGESALAEAGAADRRLADGEAAPLTGIPLAMKDIFNTCGVPTTCASKILANYVAPYDATAFARLKRQGAVLLGKVNMDEFAMGSSNENSAYRTRAQPVAYRLRTGRLVGG